MGHDHSHAHDHSTHGDDSSFRRLAAAFVINTVFFLVVLGGAFVSNSLTLMAEALHMVTDSASLILAIFAAWLASKPADAARTYGYNRAEVLAGLVNGVVLVGVAGYIVYDAFTRLQEPFEVDPVVIVVIGVVGLIANIVAAGLLINDRDNINVEGVFLHLAVDAASSFAVVVGGVIIYFTGFHVVDPILAVLIAFLVLYSVSDLLRDSLNILLQGSPREVDVDEVVDVLERVNGVVGAHHVHLWALDSNTIALSTHIVVRESAEFEQMLYECHRSIDNELDIDHMTIQVESEECINGVETDCYTTDE